MNDQLLQKLKTRLEDMERDIWFDLQETDGEVATIDSDCLEDYASRAEARQSKRVALELKARQQRKLRQVQDALDRISAGHYARCSRCRNEIAPERLKIQPEPFCVLTARKSS